MFYQYFCESSFLYIYTIIPKKVSIGKKMNGKTPPEIQNKFSLNNFFLHSF